MNSLNTKMNKPILSIFLGGIRPQNWMKLYESLTYACKTTRFELVICGPYLPPKELEDIYNFKYIKDYGSCSRAAQIAALNCEGRLITLGADDGVYEPDSLDKAVEMFFSIDHSTTKPVVLGLRYEEGGNKMYEQDWYWHMKSHEAMRFLPGIPNDTPMSLNSIMRLEFFKKIGGYDTVNFETCNWGGHDLMIRMWKHGIEFKQFKQKNLSVTWSPGETEEHKPIYLSDHCPEPTSNYHTFVKMYSKQNNPRIAIDAENWIDSETVWSKRFNVTT